MIRESFIEVFENKSAPGYEVRWESVNGGIFTVYYLGKEMEEFSCKGSAFNHEKATVIADRYFNTIIKSINTNEQ